MKKIYYLLFICSILLASCSDEITESETGQGSDYTIYQQTIEKSLEDYHGLIILSDSTFGDLIFNSINVDSYYSNFEGLQKTTFLNYIYKNNQREKLKRIPNINFVFSSDYIDTIRENKANVFLSRVGYNESKTQAVVTIGIIFGPKAGHGILYIFERNENGWYIYKQYTTWIS